MVKSIMATLSQRSYLVFASVLISVATSGIGHADSSTKQDKPEAVQKSPIEEVVDKFDHSSSTTESLFNDRSSMTIDVVSPGRDGDFSPAVIVTTIEGDTPLGSPVDSRSIGFGFTVGF